MEEKTIGYAEAIAEIETILERFNSEQFDIDTLAAEVKRATGLIALCRGKLRSAEQEVAKVLSDTGDMMPGGELAGETYGKYTR